MRVEGSATSSASQTTQVGPTQSIELSPGRPRVESQTESRTLIKPLCSQVSYHRSKQVTTICPHLPYHRSAASDHDSPAFALSSLKRLRPRYTSCQRAHSPWTSEGGAPHYHQHGNLGWTRHINWILATLKDILATLKLLFRTIYDIITWFLCEGVLICKISPLVQRTKLVTQPMLLAIRS